MKIVRLSKNLYLLSQGRLYFVEMWLNQFCGFFIPGYNVYIPTFEYQDSKSEKKRKFQYMYMNQLYLKFFHHSAIGLFTICYIEKNP